MRLLVVMGSYHGLLPRRNNAFRSEIHDADLVHPDRVVWRRNSKGPCLGDQGENFRVPAVYSSCKPP